MKFENIKRFLICMLLVYISINGYSQKNIFNATVTQPVSVIITSQPKEQVKCPGSNATFSINVSGSTPYYYQWLKNGNIIPNATSSTYSISNVSLLDQGIYSCSVSNLCRVIISNGAELKIVTTSISKIPKIISSEIIFSWNKRVGRKYIVFVKQTKSDSVSPTNNVSYIANDTFGLGSQIGTTGWYCVYNDTGTSVIIKGLIPDTSYIAFLAEYLGDPGYEIYLSLKTGSCNPLLFTTLHATPSLQANNLIISGTTSNSFIASWKIGSGSNRTVFIKQGISGNALPVNDFTYMASTTFGNGTQIGSTGWFCVYNDTGRTVSINNLTSNTAYRVMVCEYNGTSGTEQYNTTMVTNNPVNQTTDFTKPTQQASNINFSNISSSGVDVNYTRGNGTACLVLITEGTTTYPPVLDNTSYTVSSQVGTSGWYCQYSGSANSTSLTGLHPATYRVMVCEYNGISGFEKYLSDTALRNPCSFGAVNIKNQVLSKITIYPNPFTHSTTISFPNDNKLLYNLRIYDLSGKMARNVQNIRESQVIVLKADLIPGLYYFEILGKDVFRGRFVVE